MWLSRNLQTQLLKLRSDRKNKIQQNCKFDKTIDLDIYGQNSVDATSRAGRFDLVLVTVAQLGTSTGKQIWNGNF